MGKITSVVHAVTRKGRGLLAVLTLVCGFGIMWGSTVGGARTKSSLEEAAAKAIQIDSRVTDAANNGKLIVVSGRLASEESLGDEFIRPGAYLVLKRHVEMYQWNEIASSDATHSGEMFYELGWFEGEIDSFLFRQPAGHENPLLKISSEEKRVSAAQFGGFDGGRLIEKMSKLPRLSLSNQMLLDRKVEIRDNIIYVHRVAGTDEPALGDMRIWYEALPQNVYTVLTVQHNATTLVGPDEEATIFVREGAVSASELFTEAASESEAGFGVLVTLGGIITFVGMFSLLVPFAESLDLRPSVALQGKAAAAFISAIMAGGGAIVFWLLALVG